MYIQIPYFYGQAGSFLQSFLSSQSILPSPSLSIPSSHISCSPPPEQAGSFLQSRSSQSVKPSLSLSIPSVQFLSLLPPPTLSGQGLPVVLSPSLQSWSIPSPFISQASGLMSRSLAGSY